MARPWDSTLYVESHEPALSLRRRYPECCAPGFPMVPRESTPVVVFVVAAVAHVVAAPAVVTIAPAPPIVAPLMAFVQLPVPAVVVVARPDLTRVGSSRPHLHPVFASATVPHH